MIILIFSMFCEYSHYILKSNLLFAPSQHPDVVIQDIRMLLVTTPGCCVYKEYILSTTGIYAFLYFIKYINIRHEFIIDVRHWKRLMYVAQFIISNPLFSPVWTISGGKVLFDPVTLGVYLVLLRVLLPKR